MGALEMAEFEIRSKEALEAWLDGKPREISAVLASRLAMRVFPLIRQVSSQKNFEPDILLPLCRVMILAWVAGKYPAHGRDFDFTFVVRTAFDDVADAVCTAFDAAAFASSATFDAGAFAFAFAFDAAAYAAAYAADPAAAAADIWASLEADCNWLVGAAGSEDTLSADHASALAGRRLWPNHMPEWAKEEWQDLKVFMERAGNDWPVWIRWYEARLSGRPSLDAPGDIVEKLDLNIARIDEEDWKKGPAHANAMIAGFYEEAEQEAREREQALSTGIPDQTPAAIKPVWQDGILTLPAASVADDFADGSIEEVFAALKEEILSRVSNLEKNETNIDQRIITYLKALAEKVPEQVPPQHELFQLAHHEITLASLSRNTQDELSALGAAQFESLVWLFRETMDKFPEWRAFKRKPSEKAMSKENAEDVSKLVEDFIVDMASETAKTFISPLLVTAFQHLAKILSVKLEDPLRDFQIEIAFRAQDLLDGLANTFKAIASELLKAFKEGASEEAKRLAKNLGRLFIGAPIIGGGSIVLKPVLLDAIVKFPDQLGWLKPYLELLPLLF